MMISTLQAQLLTSQKNQTKLSIYGKKKAVIGGNLGDWKLKPGIAIDEPTLSLYYIADKNKNNSAKGEFILPDFKSFVHFLSFLNYRQLNVPTGGEFNG